jgi:hypothetical protein
MISLLGILLTLSNNINTHLLSYKIQRTNQLHLTNDMSQSSFIAKLFEKWTLQGLLDELDTIELFEAPGHGRVLGKVTETQKGIFEAMGVEPPSL